MSQKFSIKIYKNSLPFTAKLPNGEERLFQEGYDIYHALMMISEDNNLALTDNSQLSYEDETRSVSEFRKEGSDFDEGLAEDMEFQVEKKSANG